MVFHQWVRERMRRMRRSVDNGRAERQYMEGLVLLLVPEVLSATRRLLSGVVW